MGDPLEDMVAGKIRTVEFSGGQVVLDAPRAGRVYLSGSYNPLHDGHRCDVAPPRAIITIKLSHCGKHGRGYGVNRRIMLQAVSYLC